MTTSTCVERRRLRARLVLLSISTILCSGLALPAAAQLAPAPVRHAIDSNGVDLFYGTFTVNGPAISMGQADQGLSYQQLNRGGAWFDDVLPWAYISSSYINVGHGDTVDSFTISGSAYIPQEGDGATLAYDGTSIYTYTRADGTVIHFDHSKVATYPGYSGAGRVTDIRRPSGLTLIFNYDSLPYCSSSKPSHAGSICLTHGNYYRIGSVQNMFGYKLNFGYPAIDPYDPNDPDVPPDVNT